MTHPIIKMNSFYLHSISANGYRGLSTFPNVHAFVNVNGIREFPATTEQSELHNQAEISDRLDPRENSSIFTAKDVLKNSNSHVKFISDIKMRELHKFIGANGNCFRGEFEVRKQIIIANSYLIFFSSNIFIQ